MADPGDGSGVRTPIRPDACLRLKFLHRQDRISLFNWLIFLMKRALRFATKLNCRDIQVVIVLGYLPMICSPLLSTAVFPAPTATGVHRLRNMWSSLLSQLVDNGCDNSADSLFLSTSQIQVKFKLMKQLTGKKLKP